MEINQETYFTFHKFKISEVNEILIQTHCAEIIAKDIRGFYDLHPKEININHCLFDTVSDASKASGVEVVFNEENLILSCNCSAPKNKLCSHQAQAVLNIINRSELRIFFDKKMREEMVKQIAVPYGLQDETNLDELFQLDYKVRKVEIRPKQGQLLSLTNETIQTLQEQLFSESEIPRVLTPNESSAYIVVLKQHKFYKHLFIELYEVTTTQGGKIKNPLHPIKPLEVVWKTDKVDEVKFFTGISRFQNTHTSSKTLADLEGLRAIFHNPLQLNFYYHDSDLSENVSANSILPLRLGSLTNDVKIFVESKEDFYEIIAKVKIENKWISLEDVSLKYDFFLFSDKGIHLVGDFDLLKVIDFFKQKGNSILIHHSKYDHFRSHILAKMEDKVKVSYTYLKKATKAQLVQNGFSGVPEKIIYLSDFGSYVMINPVMKYGEVEIPVLTKRLIYTVDNRGDLFLVRRDEKAEIEFTAILLQQHEDFTEQLANSLLYFYLHKSRFLDEDWFLNAFEDFYQNGIAVYGFNEIKENKLNPNKAKVSILVTSGVNWFNTSISVKFGKKKASLKEVHKSVRNKSKFVQLGDGTVGILPAEWMQKFSNYFYSGEILDEETLITPKINFSSIQELYDTEMLDESVSKELKLFYSKLDGFKSIKEIDVSHELQAPLRDYQKQGLNWLNFLDEFNFGGCLADDMGLGKSIQIIAFILSQREKYGHTTNLLVVPTSLLFNWQLEIRKFAPSITTLVSHGSVRVKDTSKLNEFELIITSYGTLVSDIQHLKEYTFNYIFLDESQNIKNPTSQRYQAARLLKARNRIVITGTPIENNTFDLFGQLSFACPGLLGNKQYFRDLYSIPIDKFKDSKRAAELQKKVNPFILRRTKEQVAIELPEKTEMVIYCEMGTAQRKVYDTYEKEFREFISSTGDDDMTKRSMHVLRGLTKLRQICDSPLLLGDEKLFDDSSAKIQTLVEQIQHKSSKHKILVFSQFVSMLDLVKKEFEARNINYEYLTGSTRDRASVVNNFQNDDTIKVFLISLKAGGVGLNLTQADYVYLIDPWWNPAVENQAIDRCYRIGQKKNVVAVRLICSNTIEEKMMKLQNSKKDLVDELVRTDTSVLKSLSKNDLLSLVSGNS